AVAVAKAVTLLDDLGVHVEPIELPGEDLGETFRVHWYSGAANRFAAVPADLAHLCDPGFVAVAEVGARILASALAAAQLRRAAFGAAMDKLLAKLDFIVSPATPIPAFEVDPEIPGDVILDRGVNAGSFAFPINLSQQPAVSTPCGVTAAGLPIGLQFVGARGADAKVLSAARDFERASGEGRPLETWTHKSHVRIMSALPPKADINLDRRHVCFVPKADSCTAAIGSGLDVPSRRSWRSVQTFGLVAHHLF